MSRDLRIRVAEDADVGSITDIYSHHVRHGTGSFEIDPPDAAEIASRLSEIQGSGLPYIVAELDNMVVGYAYAAIYRTRIAYRFTVEDSVYVHPDYTGQGIGLALLPKVIDACRESGFRQMIAVIGGGNNIASIRLHEKCGFRHVGILEGVGFKFEQWIDTVLMQRPLS